MIIEVCCSLNCIAYWRMDMAMIIDCLWIFDGLFNCLVILAYSWRCLMKLSKILTHRVDFGCINEGCSFKMGVAISRAENSQKNFKNWLKNHQNSKSCLNYFKNQQTLKILNLPDQPSWIQFPVVISHSQNLSRGSYTSNKVSKEQ